MNADHFRKQVAGTALCASPSFLPQHPMQNVALAPDAANRSCAIHVRHGDVLKIPHRVNSLQEDARLNALLARLHAQNGAQAPDLIAYVGTHGLNSVSGSVEEIAEGRDFWGDKMVALEPDKATFCYHLCRALGARLAVEAGTSFGVSTLYLAAALRDNGGGKLIATEYEPRKAEAARANWAEAGLGEQIELREGDVRETLKTLQGPVDFLLMDIWIPMARPALDLVAPKMRQGAVAIADNTTTYRDDYADYFAGLLGHGFSTLTLPFDGGLEMSVKLTEGWDRCALTSRACSIDREAGRAWST